MAALTKLTIIKLIELILVIVLLVLHYDTVNGTSYEELLSMTAFGGYLIILIGIFAGATTGTPVNRRIDLYFTLVGCVLFIVTGIMIFNNQRVKHMVRGILAVIEGVLFLVDAVFTFRGEA
ncbi:uncharacterized protein LOC106639054 [Copidosoma floridanum]|uniref:uncharacterized protein LOC106639054 n=1 Tax=Copidosoma floridanum TaxID=29053 RepID=UPI0006C9AF37|nr:uncharacterized protein LOC106639054 [Copidosoma floridanum]